MGQQSPPSGCLLLGQILSISAFGSPGIRSSNFFAITTLFLTKSNFFFSLRGAHVIPFFEVLTSVVISIYESLHLFTQT